MSLTVSAIMPGHWVTTHTVSVQIIDGFVYADSGRHDNFVYGPNRWGQVGLQLNFYNESAKTVKRANFLVSPSGSSDLSYAKQIFVNGPINGHSTFKANWGCLWENCSVSGVQVLKTRIEYSDGTVEENEKEEQLYDYAVGMSKSTSVTLGVCALASIAASIYGETAGFYLPAPPVLFVLMILLPLAALFFSRNKSNRSAAVKCMGAAFGVSAINLFRSLYWMPRFLWRLGLSPRGRSISLVNNLDICFALATFLVFGAAFLCLFRNIKKLNSKRLLVGLTGSAAIIYLETITEIMSIYHRVSEWFPFISLIIPILLYVFIYTVVARCRNVYPKPQ